MAGRFIMEGVPTSHNPELHITLSFTFGDPGGQFSGGDEMASRGLHAEVQSAPSAAGAFISRAV
jgi:hypothetical protein